MNILIIGAGSIGICLGASIAFSGGNVSFLASEKTASAMRENGIKRVGVLKHIDVFPEDFEVYTKYSDIPRDNYDFVFVATKTTKNEEISKKLDENKDVFKKDGKIIIFQNGFGNDEAYLRYFEDDKVFCARLMAGFRRIERNISEVTAYALPILLGSLQNADINDLNPITHMISSSGFPCEITDELVKDLWAKMLYNCTLNPLGAILDLSYGGLYESKYAINIMDQLIDEIFNVIEASGYGVEWNSANEYKDIFYSKLLPEGYNHISSTSQDIKQKQKTEIDTLNGKVIDLGDKYDVDVSVNKVIYNLIKTIESDF